VDGERGARQRDFADREDAKVVSAIGPTEPTVLVALARCLVAYSAGAVPR
jgi:hypothetical protein